MSNILKTKVAVKNGTQGLSFGDYWVAMPELNDTAQEGNEVIVAVRPEEFFIDEKLTTGIPATIRHSVFLGVNTHYFLELSGGQEIEVIQNTELTNSGVGSKVYLTVDAPKINVFTADGTQNLIAGGRGDETERL